MRTNRLSWGLVAILLLAPAVRAASDQGEVTEIKKQSFTIKNPEGELVTYQVADKLVKPKKAPRVYWRHLFKDLKQGQMIHLGYYLDGKKIICDQLRIIKDVPISP